MPPFLLGIISKPLGALGSVAFLVMIGVALHAVWDYHAPFGWGAGQRLEHAAQQLAVANDRIGQCAAQRDAAIAKTWTWKGVYDRVAAARRDDAAKAGAALAAASARGAAQCRDAFNAGVATGRAIGGKTDAKNPGRGGSAPSRGVSDDDLRADWTDSGSGR